MTFNFDLDARETFECNLCGMQFTVNSLENTQIKKHQRWHQHCKKEKRNTTEGAVEWVKIN